MGFVECFEPNRQLLVWSAGLLIPTPGGLCRSIVNPFCDCRKSIEHGAMTNGFFDCFKPIIVGQQNIHNDSNFALCNHVECPLAQWKRAYPATEAGGWRGFNRRTDILDRKWNNDFLDLVIFWDRPGRDCRYSFNVASRRLAEICEVNLNTIRIDSVLWRRIDYGTFYLNDGPIGYLKLFEDSPGLFAHLEPHAKCYEGVYGNRIERSPSSILYRVLSGAVAFILGGYISRELLVKGDDSPYFYGIVTWHLQIPLAFLLTAYGLGAFMECILYLTEPCEDCHICNNVSQKYLTSYALCNTVIGMANILPIDKQIAAVGDVGRRFQYSLNRAVDRHSPRYDHAARRARRTRPHDAPY